MSEASDAAKLAAEKEAARKAIASMEELQAKFPGISDSVAAVTSVVKGLQEKVDALAKIDVASVMKEVEMIKAAQKTVREMVRTSKSGVYIPGLEDQAERFSITRAVRGAVTGKWDGAGLEHEVMKQAGAVAKSNTGLQDTSAGFFIPDQVIPDVISAIYTRSILINLAGDGQTRVSVLAGLTAPRVRVPKFDGGMIAYWVGENDDFAESESKTGDVTLGAKKLGFMTRFSKESLTFTSYGYENLVRNDMIRAAAKEIDRTIIYGKGTEHQPRGIAFTDGIYVYSAENGVVYTHNNSVIAPAGIPGTPAGAELTFDGLQNMIGALEDNDIDVDPSFAVLSHGRYWRRLKQLKITNFSGQTSSQPYLIGVPMLTDAKLRDLVGVDIDKASWFPTQNDAGQLYGWSSATDVNNCGDVVAGNLSNVLLGTWGGFEIEDDGGRGSGFVRDQTLVKLRMYTDVAVRQPKNLILCPDARMR